MRRWAVALTAVTAGVAISLAPSTLGGAGALGAPVSRSMVPPATVPQYTWPELDHGPDLDGTSNDPSISTANASTLGVSWMTYTGAPVLSSPTVAWNNKLSETLVYVGNEAGTFSALNPGTGDRLYKLSADTGAVQCSAPLPLNTDASPVVATPPGGTRTIYMGTNDSGQSNGPLIAINEATCAVDFSVTPEPTAGVGGIWDGISYA